MAIRSRAASHWSISVSANAGVATSSGTAIRLMSGIAISAAMPERAAGAAPVPATAARSEGAAGCIASEHPRDVQTRAAVFEEAVDGVGQSPVPA